MSQKIHERTNIFPTRSDSITSWNQKILRDVNKVFKRRLDIQRKITELEGNDDRRGKKTRAAKIEKLKEEYAALTEAIEDYRKSQNGSTDDLE